MSLSAREKLGPYEIVALIGVGGMGEVYRAHDPRLGRDVALKISGERFTERFEREARVIASLNHPNICTLYDVGPNYLVMELVEGPTLAERIAEGAIPLDEALNVARQIADALEAAHEAGITHRDLKPGNIKIKPDGAVKVLDFGLAKVGATPTVPTADSPTFTMATQVGVILGTAAYMAPEQAKGKPVDKRADIWAFGVVLYEMLTGTQAFTGETVTDVMASVVKEQPGLAALPVQVRAVVERCLSKDPRSRWRDIGDVRWALDHVGFEPEVHAGQARHSWWPWIIASLVTLALPAVWFLKPKPDQPLLQMEISAPEGTKLGPVNYGQLALSPDGRRLAFLATGKDGRRMLWMRLLEATSAAPLAGTENAARPFWSPDSRWIGFHAAGKLQKIDVNGGPPKVICETAEAGSVTWNSDGVILFSGMVGGSMPIQRVPAADGTPTPVFPLDTSREETSQLSPWFLPDGRHFLFASRAKESGTVLGSLDGKSRRFLFPTDSPALYAPNPAGGGWILYLVGNRLMARPFDPGKREFTGEAATIADSLHFGPSWSTSTNGLLAFRRTHQFQTQLTWFNRDGKQSGTAGDPTNASTIGNSRGTFPRISPDQKTVAFCVRGDGGNTGIWLFDIARTASTLFTLEPGNYGPPIWSPDGNRIFYCSVGKNGGILAERSANRVGAEKIVRDEPGKLFFPSGVSRDVNWVVTESRDIMLIQRAGGKSILFLKGGGNGSISPDGLWLLYTYPRSSGSHRDVFVQSLPVEAGGSPGVVGKWQISNAGGGANPVWRGDGKEIFYLASDGKLMAVPVESGGNFFRPGIPKALFQTRLPQNNSRDYDVTADGQRFLIDQPVEDSGDEPITVIVNWPKLLQK